MTGKYSNSKSEPEDSPESGVKRRNVKRSDIATTGSATEARELKIPVQPTKISLLPP